MFTESLNHLFLLLLQVTCVMTSPTERSGEFHYVTVLLLLQVTFVMKYLTERSGEFHQVTSIAAGDFCHEISNRKVRRVSWSRCVLVDFRWLALRLRVALLSTQSGTGGRQLRTAHPNTIYTTSRWPLLLTGLYLAASITILTCWHPTSPRAELPH